MRAPDCVRYILSWKAESEIASLRGADGDAINKISEVEASIVMVDANVDGLETRVVAIGAVVANMSECDAEGQHHTKNGVCQRSSSWSCPALEIKFGTASIKGEVRVVALPAHHRFCPSSIYPMLKQLMRQC
jgi:hypothetical protein